MNEDPNLFWVQNLPRGWEMLYRTLLADIAAAGRVVKIAQAKEKFGVLRVYLAEHDEPATALVAAAERRSARICQECGAEAELMVDAFFYATLCPLHSEGFEKALQQPMVSMNIRHPEE